MDKPIQQSSRKTWRLLLPIMGLGAVGLATYLSFASNFSNQLKVNRAELLLASVSKKEFRDYLALTGYVRPAKVFYLDASERGIVEEVFTSPGEHLKKGDTLLKLSNSDLELEVMQRESDLYEQLNGLRQTRLLLNQNDLAQRARLAEIDYQLKLLKPQYQRAMQLLATKAIAKASFEETAASYQYNRNRRKLVYQSYRSDSIGRDLQLLQLEKTELRIRQHLKAVQQLTNRLLIRAPTGGQLSGLSINEGEVIEVGQRLGQIDNLEKKILQVSVDELFIDRIFLGQKGEAQYQGELHGLTVSKIYPTVSNGQFRIECKLEKDPPRPLKIGQSLRLKLFLGELERCTLLPVGSFYSHTGGNWVFVLSNGEAHKRKIQLGRKNRKYHEVLSGLRPGEEVIISGYQQFKGYEKLLVE